MKRVLFIATLLVAMFRANAQEPQANWNIATYKDYDSTTFFLGAAKGEQWITVDFATASSDDIVMFVGVRDKDGQGAGNLFWQGSTSNPDSVILNKTTHTNKIRTSNGTRYSTTRVYLWFPDGIPDDYLAFTFVWNTAATGRIKVYYGKR